jgi:phosphoribosylanthranilate isomerase
VTRVKICGITNLEDALVSVELGADMLGFNFYEKSARYISPKTAGALVSEMPDNIEKVGVFVNKSVEEIFQLLNTVSLDTVQLHGDEPPEFIDALRGRTAVKLIKAIRVGQKFDPAVISDFRTDGILLDAFSKSGYGGTGETFAWDRAKNLGRSIPRLYLAGGLHAGNVSKAVKSVRPYAVDVASGVESFPGKKDPAKLEAFIANAKNA